MKLNKKIFLSQVLWIYSGGHLEVQSQLGVGGGRCVVFHRTYKISSAEHQFVVNLFVKRLVVRSVMAERASENTSAKTTGPRHLVSWPILSRKLRKSGKFERQFRELRPPAIVPAHATFIPIYYFENLFTRKIPLCQFLFSRVCKVEMVRFVSNSCVR